MLSHLIVAEYYQLYLLEQWPNDLLKQPTLAAACSTLASLEAGLPVGDYVTEMCRVSRKSGLLSFRVL